MSLEQTTLGTGIRYEDIQALDQYWQQVRKLYSCFDANLLASDSSVFWHEMPGGQYTNLQVRVFIADFQWFIDSSRLLVPSQQVGSCDSVGGDQGKIC